MRFRVPEQPQQALAVHDQRVKVDLQGTDAGGQLEHPLECLFLEPEHQRVGAEAQAQVQLDGAVFHQQVAVAAGAVGDGHAGFFGTQGLEDGGGRAL